MKKKIIVLKLLKLAFNHTLYLTFVKIGVVVVAVVVICGGGRVKFAKSILE